MRLIPNEICQKTKSTAEVKVYQWLKRSQRLGVAIHSLELSKHVSKIYGEIDFLVITERGVMCLEVKGGQVHVHQGQWTYTNLNNESFVSNESPFKQARENKETLYSYIKEHYTKKSGSEIKTCLYGYGVVVPDTMLMAEAIDIDQEIVYDFNSDSFDNYLDQLYDTWEERVLDRIHQDQMPSLKNGHISLLVELLLGKTIEVSQHKLSDDFLCSDNTLRQMSEAQYKIFQYGIQNRRQLVEGGAGTGKSVIAMKYAFEKVTEGNRVLYICFNKLLARSINKQLKKQGIDDQRLKVINFHDFLMEETQRECPEDKFMFNDFYKNQLPEAYLSIEDVDSFDTLIIDEGQDLLFENYLLCLDRFLIGGLNNGNWLILYDENQNIYLEEAFESGLKEIKRYQPVLGQLKENYRNTKQIDEKNRELTHIHSKAFAGLNGEIVDLYEYNDHDHGRKRLKTIIKHLHKQGVKNKDIVILSPRRFEHSMLEGHKDILGSKSIICPMQNLKGEPMDVDETCIAYSTIYSFKGLESHVVILIDVGLINDSSKRLYYTGFSRAKSKLVIMSKAKEKE